MKLKIELNDINGSIIKLLLSAILLYKCLIQYYIEINGMFTILGSLLLVAVLVDCKFNLSIFLFDHSKALIIMMIYFALTFTLGFIVSPDISVHMSTGLTVIEFLFVAICISYYGKTRHTTDFIVTDYLVFYGILLALLIFNPAIVSTSQGIRYSINDQLNENALALYASLFVWAVLYRVSQKRISTMVGFLLIGVALYCCIMTASRKGFLAFAIIIILWILFVYLKGKNSILRFCFLLFVVIIFSYYFLPNLLESNLWTRLKDFGDAGTKNRIDMYQVGMQYLKTSPALGIGFNGFRYYYGYYSHSSIVEVFVTSGIPLGIMYFYSFVQLFINMKNKRKNMLNMSAMTEEAEVGFKMRVILLITIVISFAYIIHMFELSTYYSLGIILMWEYFTPQQSDNLLS